MKGQKADTDNPLEENQVAASSNDVLADVIAAYDAADDGEPSAEPDESATPATPAEPAPKETKSARKAPAKDEKGRFVKKAEATAKTPLDAPPEEPEPQDFIKPEQDEAGKPAAKAKENAPVNGVLPAPHSWSKDAREDWHKIPPEVQKYIHQWDRGMQTSYIKKTQEMARTAKRYEELDQAIQPYEQELAMRGVTPAQFFKQSVSVDKLLRKGPTGVIQFLQYLGISPQQLVSAPQAAGPNAGPGPVNGSGQAPASMSREQIVLQTRLDRLEREREQERRAIAQQRISSVNDEITRFREEVDQAGNARFPYVPEVEEEMAHYIGLEIQRAKSQGRAPMPARQLLEKAYDYTTRGNPEVWAKIEQDRRQSEEAQQVANAQKKVVAARRAGSSLPSSSRSAAPDALPEDIEGLVAHCYNALE